jgi:hypothetical protein
VSYDLLITRAGDATPIGRHTWLNTAVETPLLVLKTLHPELPEDQGVDHPAFGLYTHHGRPILFWRNGEVIVKHVEDEFLPDLVTIARVLDARLVHPDGTEAASGD